MRIIFSTFAAMALLASNAFAESTVAAGPQLTGSIEVETTRDAVTDNWGTTTTIGAGIFASGIGFGSVSFESVDAGTIEVDEWKLGTSVSDVTVSLGDQGSVFVEAWSDHSAIAAPTIDESIRLSMGDATVALGFADFGNDILDLGSIQSAYNADLGVLNLGTSFDYNMDSEEYAVGARALTEGPAAGIQLGGALSYASVDENIAYEIDAHMSGISVYLNGDKDELLENVGAGYAHNIGGLDLYAKVNYGLETEEFTPTAGVSFSF